MKPLAEYGRKRNFRVTSEPGPKVKRSKTKKLTYVIQEHHASHLHYDFRLEWDGVLKSWAVPKGPSLDPSQRRLAVEVEDHPLDYATFTGTIPEGEYGGGEVYRWDMGSWEPVNDPDEGLRKGRLEFNLKGKKLKGGFLLVRTRGRDSSKPQWLLIKRHDKYAQEGATLKMAAPTTVKARTRKARKGSVAALPEFISPQLAQLVNHPPTGTDWVHEMKFDGYRIQAHIQKGKVKLYTRRGHDWTDKYPSLAKALAKADIENAVMDGEIVWQDDQGRSNFQALQNAMKAKRTDALVYWAFDLLFLNGKDMTSLPLIARKERLEKIIENLGNQHIRFSEHFRQSGQKLMNAMCAMDLEGVISKRVDTPYAPGRHNDWVKSKCTKRQEFVVGGYSDAEGSRVGFGSLLLGVYDKGELRYAGKVGTSFDQNLLNDIGKKLRKLETKTCPFVHGAPRGSRYHWVRPKLVAEVSFSEWTSDHHLRVPVFQGLRTDKAPEQIGREKEKPVVKDHVLDVRNGEKQMRASTAKAKSKKAKAPVEKKTGKKDFSQGVHVTHPDRIIYKKEGLTKQDVADYYHAVSQWILPHIEERPLSLVRCTQDSTTACFFSKHFAERLPEHLIGIPEKGKQPWVTVDSTEGLMALIQYGTLEIHPWNCHRQKIEKPDQIVLDFDPDPSVDFEVVKAGALEVRDLLKQLGLRSFLKVTGGKGLHVQFPFEPVYDWDTVKSFSKTLVLEMASRHPELYTANLVKAARKGRIFLDYLRNGRGATAVAPYSLRAKPLSSVAMPISWDELEDLPSADLFTMEKALEHLHERKRDPWKDYFATKQKISLLS